MPLSEKQFCRGIFNFISIHNFSAEGLLVMSVFVKDVSN